MPKKLSRGWIEDEVLDPRAIEEEVSCTEVGRSKVGCGVCMTGGWITQ
jgi:hypothetical protein